MFFLWQATVMLLTIMALSFQLFKAHFRIYVKLNILLEIDLVNNFDKVIIPDLHFNFVITLSKKLGFEGSVELPLHYAQCKPSASLQIG